MHTTEEQATGCIGAHSYKDYARQNGYKHVEVLNWSSSAGDWQFLISKNRRQWRILFQENNYPRPGFTHSIGEEIFEGTLKQVCREIDRFYT